MYNGNFVGFCFYIEFVLCKYIISIIEEIDIVEILICEKYKFIRKYLFLIV